MSTQTIFGILFLLGGIFQSITAYLIYQGHEHYIMRLTNRKIGIVIYIIFALLLFLLAYINLFGRGHQPG
ncbi:MAG TPA: hypothetical protein VFS25_24610 [Chitinophaga sp.]|jgi:hypothetical protein|uniref:hypothetical protein n=1 Tax=Chitinophaga sp. TaxID=1869181 RepID=UPI002DBA412E|nr:hypothetical protein [Chitinophaga sp.]HEU4556052.1 hypothetical protein [Chitinophaga sp.]